MNGFLVVLRHTMDDLALGLFDTWDDAYEDAMSREWEPTENERALYTTDCSTPCSIAIVTFEQSRPTEVRIVRLYADDEKP